MINCEICRDYDWPPKFGSRYNARINMATCSKCQCVLVRITKSRYTGYKAIEDILYHTFLLDSESICPKCGRVSKELRIVCKNSAVNADYVTKPHMRIKDLAYI